MIHLTDDTIAAIATPIGEGAISVIRVSGPSAIQSVSDIFRGKKNLRDVKSHTAHFGLVMNKQGEVVDEVVCTIYRAPHSYTGEDVVEVSCHGGIHNTKKVLNCILEKGIRPAKPGEFTLRAFLNGRMDLSQAEAVADLIKIRSERGHKNAVKQLEGELSKKMRELRDQLIKATSLLELELDFAEENIELINKNTIENYIRSSVGDINKLLESYYIGRVLKEGVSIALIGIPNAGKSSLLNAILKEERAIVTEIPGTTRDFIEEEFIHEGVLYRLIDTAGLRQTEDPIEIEGIKRTWNVAEQSDVIVFIHDGTKELSEEEKIYLEKLESSSSDEKPVFIAYNKIDLLSDRKAKLKKKVFLTSAKTSEGVEELVRAIANVVFEKEKSYNEESIVITNQRHFYALMRAKEHLLSALNSIKEGKSEEFVALDLRGAIDSIGEIIGIVTTEDILNEIFSKFCIGKYVCFT